MTESCGRAVGLPEGQMGNSEVGHLNLGAGAVVKQDLTRIDEAVEDDEDGRRHRQVGHRAGAASTIAVNWSTSSDAPPTRAPSQSGSASSSAALSGLTEPP